MRQVLMCQGWRCQDERFPRSYAMREELTKATDLFVRCLEEEGIE